MQVSLSESSVKLPPSESESFTISLILSLPIYFFCEVFSALTLVVGVSMFLVLHTKDQLPSRPVDTSELHALTAPRYFMASEGLDAGTKINNTQSLTRRSDQLMAHVYVIEADVALISIRRRYDQWN